MKVGFKFITGPFTSMYGKQPDTPNISDVFGELKCHYTNIFCTSILLKLIKLSFVIN